MNLDSESSERCIDRSSEFKIIMFLRRNGPMIAKEIINAGVEMPSHHDLLSFRQHE